MFYLAKKNIITLHSTYFIITLKNIFHSKVKNKEERLP